ncbi:MAG: DNA mismatch repair endonuclease MutL [Promethearchaeota archaeon]
MGKIHFIDEYEKIAAGEVIDRPASAVKELLENAIDAGATRIEIRVEKAGKKLIKIIDNGSGIAPEDVLMAFERHATSKIENFSDIYALSTLGFRGEALSSIKAIARVEMVTRTSSQDVGKKVIFEDDALIEESEVACPVGTSITVKKLFFNVPVRKRFLKNDAVEFAHISDIVTRYALAYHELDIKLFHNGKKVIDAPPSNGNLLNTILAIYGREHAAKMLEINETRDTFKISGYIALPDITRSSRIYSSLFVNGRYVYSLDLAKAVEQAYVGRIMKGKYPFYVLFLEINPDLIDVNIHPTKKEIKFYNEEDLCHSIREIISSKLESVIKIALPPLEISLDEDFSRGREIKIEDQLENSLSRGRSKGDLKQLTEGTKFPSKSSAFDRLLERANERIPDNILAEDRSFIDDLEDGSSIHGSETGKMQDERATLKREAKISGWKPLLNEAIGESAILDRGKFSALPSLKILSKGIQLNKTFLFFEALDGSGDLIIVDQHAASERVQYEKVKKMVARGGITSQKLLIPRPLNLPPSLLSILEEYIPVLNSFGFEIVKKQEHGKDTYEIVKIPYLFNRKLDVNIIDEFLEDVLSTGGISLTDVRESIIQSLGCHSAIRSGDVLTQKEIWNLLRQLDACDDPYHCAHGRPTFIIKKYSWLEREFKRIL